MIYLFIYVMQWIYKDIKLICKAQMIGAIFSLGLTRVCNLHNNVLMPTIINSCVFTFYIVECKDIMV